jgi:hypothetical protein
VSAFLSFYAARVIRVDFGVPVAFPLGNVGAVFDRATTGNIDLHNAPKPSGHDHQSL